MAGGYAGKVLKVNLDTRTISTIDSKPYTDKYGGAHGVGTALFWDEVVEKGGGGTTGWDMQDGTDSRNQLSVMSGPLTGTMTPCTGRQEWQGVGPQKYPVNWFTRSGQGGRFGAFMKLAGWDGIIVQGKASSPVWINIINDDVTLEDAGPDGDNLWGMTTWEAMDEIWRKIKGSKRHGEWLKLPGDEYTSQLPAVVACGPIGEALSKHGSLVSDGGSGAGQGGMGCVMGSKNLKAISVLGTGSLEISDPGALVDARTWYKANFSYNIDNPLRVAKGRRPTGGASSINFTNIRRATGCIGATQNCRQQTYSGSGNDSQCSDQMLVTVPTKRGQARVTDLGQMYGLNFFARGHEYLRDLAELGVLGAGKEIEQYPLDMDIYGTVPWAEQLLRMTAERNGLGDAWAEGDLRASQQWGRYEEDSGPGRLLNLIHWGDRWHHDAEKWWLHGSLFAERDVNEHSGLYHSVRQAYERLGTADEISADTMAGEINDRYAASYPALADPYMASQTWQGPNNEYMDDAMETGWYSASGVKEVAWHRYYSRFWQQGMQMCCWEWGIGGNFHSYQREDFKGATTQGAEERFFNAVTGKNYSFADGMDIGRRVWNMDRAIWVLQGRHRDMEHHTAERQYSYPGTPWANRAMPMYINGAWEYQNYNVPETSPFSDRDGTEAMKTHYYELEGWNTASGAPTRATLESLDLGFVADKLEAAGKI